MTVELVHSSFLTLLFVAKENSFKQFSFYISTFYRINILNSSITSVYLSTMINHINKFYAQRFLNFHKLPKKILHLFLFQDRGIRERCDSDTQCENGTTNSFCNETSGFCQCKAGSLFLRESSTCSPGQKCIFLIFF